MNRLFFPAILLILAGAVVVRASIQAQPFQVPKNQDIKIRATLSEEPRIVKGKQVLRVGDSRVYLDLYQRYFTGDVIEVEGFVRENGYIFDAKVQKLGETESLGSKFSDIRRKLSENIFSILPAREATLVVGTVLGIDAIDQDFREALLETGTIHVVVVSGQNMMIVAGIFMALARYIGRRQSLLLACFFVLSYAFLTGFEPPAIRASLMVIASSIAIYFGRDFNPLWVLGVCAFLILFIWPSAALEISFQLTFAATLGIMTLGKFLKESMEKFKLSAVGDSVAIATSAYLFTLPIVFFHFGQTSFISPLVNILVAEAVAFVMILGFITAFLSLISIGLAQIVAFAAYVPALYFVKVVEFFAGFV